MHVHVTLLVYVTCTPAGIKRCFFGRVFFPPTQMHIDTNGNSIAAAGGAKIERGGGGLFDQRERRGNKAGLESLNGI